MASGSDSGRAWSFLFVPAETLPPPSCNPFWGPCRCPPLRPLCPPRYRQLKSPSTYNQLLCEPSRPIGICFPASHHPSTISWRHAALRANHGDNVIPRSGSAPRRYETKFDYRLSGLSIRSFAKIRCYVILKTRERKAPSRRDESLRVHCQAVALATGLMIPLAPLQAPGLPLRNLGWKSPALPVIPWRCVRLRGTRACGQSVGQRSIRQGT